jgi:hypothetical protein
VSRGRVVAHPCLKCRDPAGCHPFPQCIRLAGFWDGCCANCKWPDHAIRCTVRNPGEGRQLGHGHGLIPAGLGVAGGAPPHGRVAGLLPAPGDSDDNPINLDGEEPLGSQDDPIVL